MVVLVIDRLLSEVADTSSSPEMASNIMGRALHISVADVNISTSIRILGKQMNVTFCHHCIECLTGIP
jgi:hypothetical protein